MILREKANLDRVREGVIMYRIEKGYFPSEAELPPEELFPLLAEKEKYIFATPKWRELRCFVDYWNNPVRIEVVTVDVGGKAKSFRVRVVSRGPNGRDENGQGDDIESVREWTPYDN